MNSFHSAKGSPRIPGVHPDEENQFSAARDEPSVIPHRTIAAQSWHGWTPTVTGPAVASAGVAHAFASRWRAGRADLRRDRGLGHDGPRGPTSRQDRADQCHDRSRTDQRRDREPRARRPRGPALRRRRRAPASQRRPRGSGPWRRSCDLRRDRGGHAARRHRAPASAGSSAAFGRRPARRRETRRAGQGRRDETGEIRPARPDEPDKARGREEPDKAAE